MWLTGNLKLSRQSSLPPPPVILPTHTQTHTPSACQERQHGDQCSDTIGKLCSSQGRAPTDLGGAWCWGGILKEKTREKFGKENPLVTGRGSRYCKKRRGGAGRSNEILFQQLFQEARKGLDSRVGDKVCHLPSPSCR